MIVYTGVGECALRIHYVHPNRVTGGMQMTAVVYLSVYTLEFLTHFWPYLTLCNVLKSRTYIYLYWALCNVLKSS